MFLSLCVARSILYTPSSMFFSPCVVRSILYTPSSMFLSPCVARSIFLSKILSLSSFTLVKNTHSIVYTSTGQIKVSFLYSYLNSTQFLLCIQFQVSHILIVNYLKTGTTLLHTAIETFSFKLHSSSSNRKYLLPIILLK